MSSRIAAVCGGLVIGSPWAGILVGAAYLIAFGIGGDSYWSFALGCAGGVLSVQMLTMITQTTFERIEAIREEDRANRS